MNDQQRRALSDPREPRSADATLAPPTLRAIDGDGSHAHGARPELRLIEGGSFDERSRALLLRSIGSLQAMWGSMGEGADNEGRK